MLRATRIAMVPMTLFSIVFAIYVQQTGILLTLAFDLMLACLTVPFILGLVWRRGTTTAAIAAIGGTFEGVLRGWQPSKVEGEEDRLRDTAMFSILRAEWPDVQARLTARLRAGSSRAPAEPGSS